MVRIECPEAVNGYILKITFKRWGKLWTPGNIKLRSLKEALELERRDYRIGTLLNQFPAPSPIKGFISGKVYSLKKRLAYSAAASPGGATSLLLEFINPESIPVDVSLNIRSIATNIEIPFQKLLQLQPGFSRVRVPVSEIANVIDLNRRFDIELTPNHESDAVTLFFGLMEFVREINSEKVDPELNRLAKKIVKCVVWDLDNTLWDGTLIEDGAAKLTLRPGITGVIEELDARGILQSISSKNNREEALDALKQFGINEFFLASQIGWMPKSEGIVEIARKLNIGLDSVLFVDDSDFELGEVSASLPDIQVINAKQYKEIANLEECKVAVSAESRMRRKMYVVDEQRQRSAAGFSNDYLAFLRHCKIQLNIQKLNENNLDRVHELTQRTNQMNFSGNRYNRNVLNAILSNAILDTYVMEVRDQFGSYGIVGFSIVDRRVPIMTDLMFSCRIQSKHIEHAFLCYLIREYVAVTRRDFQAEYRKTPRNAASGRVFTDIGMREIENMDGASRLIFLKEQPIPDEGIVEISVEGSVQSM
jgi:FkbH-like protein